MQHFKRYFLWYTILPLLILALAASYYRFMVLNAFEVVYEAECDPYSEQCFAWCEDEACTDIYYYKYVSRQVSDIHRLCGPDITDCEAALFCTDEEEMCSIDYCVDGSEDCETLTEADLELENDAVEFYQDFLELQAI